MARFGLNSHPSLGLCYRTPRLSLGLYSHTLIIDSNILQIACVSRVQVDAEDKSRLG